MRNELLTKLPITWYRPRSGYVLRLRR